MTGRNTIIVADDDEIFRRMLGRQLEQMGFSVVLYEDGRKVNAQVMAIKPVACIIDMVMPEKEGMETIFQLGQGDPRPKVIAVSGTQFYLDVAPQIGADAALKKPITPQMLRDTLNAVGVHP